MKHILAAALTASVLAASGIALAPTVSAAPASPVAAAAVPALICRPVPAIGLECGDLSAVPGTGSMPDVGQAIEKMESGTERGSYTATC